MKATLARAAAIVALTVLAYWPAFQAGYIWDDDTALTENPQIRSASGLREIWFSTRPYDYFPLTFTTFWLEWRLWGPKPLGYHAVNVALHALGAVLFWRVLLQLRVPGAWTAAALFAVHPVAVGSVAWVAERKNTLSLVFFLASALWYLRFDAARRQAAADARQPGRALLKRDYALSLGAFLLALLSKTSVVALPLVLALCEWWRDRPEASVRAPTGGPAAGRRHNRPEQSRSRASDGTLDAGRRVRLRSLLQTLWPMCVRLAPFFALALALGLVTVWFQTHRAMTGNIYQQDGLLTRLLGGGRALWFYLTNSLLPVQLSMIYPRWQIEPARVVSWLPGVGWLGLLAVCWRWRQGRLGPFWFGLASFTALLLPVLGFFPMSFFIHSRVADHLQYLALLPAIALVTGLVASVGARPGSGTALRLLAGAALVALGWQTFNRARVFQSAEALWRDTIAKNPGAWAAWNNLGMATRDPREEFQCYTRALELNPHYAEAHNNLGVLLFQQNRPAEAELHFREALRLQPLLAPAHNNLGHALSQSGRLDEALQHLRRAVELNPNYVDAWNNLGRALLRANDPEAAIRCFERALGLLPNQPLAHYHWGNAALILGRSAEALAHFEAATQLDPNITEARHNLAVVLLSLGRTTEALAHFHAVVQMRPDFVPARYQLAEIALQEGRPEEAVQQVQIALRHQPEAPELHELLGRAQLAQGAAAGALESLRRAVELRPDWPKGLASLAAALASVPDASLRNGPEALRLASRAFELTGGTNLLVLEALAAARAETGDFAEAARLIESALSIARSSGASNRIGELEGRRALYQAGQPFRRNPAQSR